MRLAEITSLATVDSDGTKVFDLVLVDSLLEMVSTRVSETLIGETH